MSIPHHFNESIVADRSTKPSTSLTLAFSFRNDFALFLLKVFFCSLTGEGSSTFMTRSFNLELSMSLEFNHSLFLGWVWGVLA